MYITLAPTCTVGPSRPTEAPPSNDSVVKASLPADTPSERLSRRNVGVGISRAAITCGMPLPRVGLSAPLVSHANNANTVGVSSSAHQIDWAMIDWKTRKAASLALANTIATRATATAPPHRAARRFHASLDRRGR